MIDILNLPDQDGGPLPKSKRPPLNMYDQWVNEQLRQLHDSGDLRHLREQISRRPVEQRFRLA